MLPFSATPFFLPASEPKGCLSEQRPRVPGTLQQQTQEVRGALDWGGWCWRPPDLDISTLSFPQELCVSPEQP
jgi:hypothetical protein